MVSSGGCSKIDDLPRWTEGGCNEIGLAFAAM